MRIFSSPIFGNDSRAAVIRRHPGWKPFALRTGLRPVRQEIAKTTLLHPDSRSKRIPPVKTVVLASSPGSGPSTRAPATGTISEVCPTPISASPLATMSAACAPGTKMALGHHDSKPVDDVSEIDTRSAAFRRIRIDDRFSIQERLLERIDGKIRAPAPPAWRLPQAPGQG